MQVVQIDKENDESDDIVDVYTSKEEELYVRGAK